MSQTDTNNQTNTSPLLVVLAWAVVLVPMGYGVTYTVQNAMKLFTAPTPAAAAPAAKT